MTVRTRFAPSPTGRLHLGNVRIAVFNWLFTRHHGGAFVVRIEDTDTARNVPGAESDLLDDLRWLGLTWDEGPDVGGPHGPYRQSEREAAYQSVVARLVEAGAAYPCFCDGSWALDEAPEEASPGPPVRPGGAGSAVTAGEGGLPERRYPGRCRALAPSEARARIAAGEDHVIRFRTPRAGEVEIVDQVRGAISFPASDIDDFILRRGDGRVTYNLAVVADDVDMEISHVIRGAGHISNTPKQALLFDALAAARPAFIHLPNVLAPDGGKLSKRHGAAGVAELRDQGWIPEAVVNYLSLLGWSHPEEKEILGVDELVESVDVDRLGAAEVAYDPEKMRWVGAQHMARLSLEDLVEGARPFIDRDRFPLEDERLPAALEAIRTRLATFGEVNEHLVFLYPGDDEDWARHRSQVVADPQARQVVAEARGTLEGVDPWTRDGARAAIKAVGKKLGVRGPALFHPLRKVLTAAESGPDLGGIVEAIGREETLRRLGLVSRAAQV